MLRMDERPPNLSGAVSWHLGSRIQSVLLTTNLYSCRPGFNATSHFQTPFSSFMGFLSLPQSLNSPTTETEVAFPSAYSKRVPLPPDEVATASGFFSSAAGDEESLVSSSLSQSSSSSKLCSRQMM